MNNIFDKKLADYVIGNSSLLNFLDRLNIKLGFRESTINEICNNYKIDKYFFTELMLLIINRNDFNPNHIEKFNISDTILYLRNSHKSYKTQYIPEIEKLISKLKKSEKDRETDCNLLYIYFKEYKTEFIKHLKKEDSDIFNYIIKIENNLIQNQINSKLIKYIEANTIKNYIISHDNLDEKLDDLKNLLIKYFKPFENENIIRKIIKILFELEEDLQIHELIENKILFPKAKQLEERILKY